MIEEVSLSDLVDLVLALPPGLAMTGLVTIFYIGAGSFLTGIINNSLQVSPGEQFLTSLRKAVLALAFALLVVFVALGLIYALFYVWRDFTTPLEEGPWKREIVANYPENNHPADDHQYHRGQGEDGESC